MKIETQKKIRWVPLSMFVLVPYSVFFLLKKRKTFRILRIFQLSAFLVGVMVIEALLGNLSFAPWLQTVLNLLFRYLQTLGVASFAVAIQEDVLKKESDS
ncbi:MAG: hypothetical protein IKC69_03040 [Clostridia bacterium]|nr:hypothetical protein [Clostridia bacterium]